MKITFTKEEVIAAAIDTLRIKHGEIDHAEATITDWDSKDYLTFDTQKVTPTTTDAKIDEVYAALDEL